MLCLDVGALTASSDLATTYVSLPAVPGSRQQLYGSAQPSDKDQIPKPQGDRPANGRPDGYELVASDEA